MEARAVLIDTSLFIEHIRAREKASTNLARIHGNRRRLATSSIVAAELCCGARTPEMRSDVLTLLSLAQVVPFTETMAIRMSREAELLKRNNAMIGFRDLAIACVAMEGGLCVATLNQREFARVSGVELLDLPTT